jgi:hypothetical protein
MGARRINAPTRKVVSCEKYEKEVKPLLTSHVSKIRKTGARGLNAPTREVVSCEKCEKEVKPLFTSVSQDFREEEHESSMLQLARL